MIDSIEKGIFFVIDAISAHLLPVDVNPVSGAFGPTWTTLKTTPGPLLTAPIVNFPFQKFYFLSASFLMRAIHSVIRLQNVVKEVQIG